MTVNPHVRDPVNDVILEYNSNEYFGEYYRIKFRGTSKTRTLDILDIFRCPY